MEEIKIYTDGSSLGNPGPGGYAAILVYRNQRKELSGGFKHTTNNRMELTAVIEALKTVKPDARQKIIVYTDSRLICDAFHKKWLDNWLNNGWKKSDKKPVLNKDLWEQLLELTKGRQIKFEWLKGHSGHPENERCDELSKIEASKYDLPNDTGYKLDTETITQIRYNSEPEILNISDKFVIRKDSTEIVLDKDEVFNIYEKMRNFLK